MHGTLGTTSSVRPCPLTRGQRRPKYVLGHSINLGALVITLVLTVILIGYLRWENKKRDSGERDARLVEGDVSRLGHRHPSFRYTL